MRLLDGVRCIGAHHQPQILLSSCYHHTAAAFFTEKRTEQYIRRKNAQSSGWRHHTSLGTGYIYRLPRLPPSSLPGPQCSQAITLFYILLTLHFSLKKVRLLWCEVYQSTPLATDSTVIVVSSYTNIAAAFFTQMARAIHTTKKMQSSG